MDYGIETQCIYGNGERFDGDRTGAVSFPIYQTATFAHPEAGRSTGYDYSRLQNPTREQLEQVVAALERGVDAMALSSGMAAITMMMELFRPGDHVIADANLYGGSIRLFDHISAKNGISVERVDCSGESVEESIRDNTRAIFIETPTNPMMRVIDIRKMSEIARQHDLLLIVDNTFLSPYFQKPLTLGADIVVHSGTKYLGGHNDTLAGFLVVGSGDLSERLRFIQKTTGSALSPFDSWLILRGIKTLPIRMERAQENAKTIAAYLQKEQKVCRVYYPGIEGTREYELCRSQATGFGSMLTFEVESRECALSVLKHTKLIPFAESLGGVETLLTYPATQTHADIKEEERIRGGITDRILRLSVGIESAEDLIADLRQAFRHA